MATVSMHDNCIERDRFSCFAPLGFAGPVVIVYPLLVPLPL